MSRDGNRVGERRVKEAHIRRCFLRHEALNAQDPAG